MSGKSLKKGLIPIGSNHLKVYLVWVMVRWVTGANFEEQYTGPSFQGSYVAGVYYPDKTRVGWWKNGYPDYFAKVLNAPNWIGIDVLVDGEPLDLNTATIYRF